jgi:lipopolysaccharide transport system ATP-binding protein
MSKPIIRIKNLSKRYKITQQQGGYVALRDVLTNVAKSPFRFAKDKAKKITGKAGKEEFWALKNINLDIEKGEIIGVIGRNGAGKSTLLKILSEITAPTDGEIEINGTVASLLEVGTGFHPELTGRENIFLNGAILGMSKEEIVKKFDKIVEFAGVQKFLDTPVKRYSTGMTVRLAFSVTAHLEPEILLIDEVLAVGDTEFQKKCMGKMDEVTKTAGRTILFVSHNMDAILKLCTKTVLLENGVIKMFDETKKVIDAYLEGSPLTLDNKTMEKRQDRGGKGHVKITGFYIENHEGIEEKNVILGKKYRFCIKYESSKNLTPKNLSVAIDIQDQNNKPIIYVSTKYTKQNFDIAPNKGVIKCEINQKFPLREGLYNISIGLVADGNLQDYYKRLTSFEVKQGDFYNNGFKDNYGLINIEHNWTLKKLN